uniref:Hemolysin-type calcium-binding region n=1 Tax=Psychrobacter sp. (strain PRwf-1) TaxID=349106 RepID=A5WE88_PSYWF
MFFSVVDSRGHADGPHTFVAKIEDAAGNVGTESNEFMLTVDTQAPTENNSISIDTYTDDVDPLQDDFGSGTDTNDTTPTLNGTVSGLAADDTVGIYDTDGNRLGDAILNADRTGFTYTSAALADGPHTFVAKIEDAAGNVGTESNEFMLTVDTQAPTDNNSISIDTYTDDVDPLQDDFGSGTDTNDTTPTLNGTVSGLAADDTVGIYDTDGKRLGDAILNADRTGFTYTSAALADGPHTFVAKIEDAAGNVGTESNEFMLTVDTQAPTINPQTIEYNENQEAGTDTEETGLVIGEVIASDNRGSVSYSITAGNGKGYFDINEKGQIALTQKGLSSEANDFELGLNEFDLTVTVTDEAGNSADSTVTINVNNVNEAPTAADFSKKIFEDGNVYEGNLNRPEIIISVEDLEGISPEDVQLLIGTDRVDSFYKINDDRSVTFSPREALDNGVYTLTLQDKSDTSKVLGIFEDIQVNSGYTLTIDDFKQNYNDPEGDELTEVIITSLPEDSRGVLLLGTEVVKVNDRISITEIKNGNLIFIPAKDQSDNDVEGPFASIKYKVANANTANDSAESEGDPSTITINVEPKADGTFTTVVDTALNSDDITGSGGLQKDGSLTGFNKEVQGDLGLDYKSMFSERSLDGSVYYKYYRDENWFGIGADKPFGFHQPLNNNFLKGAIETTLVEPKAPNANGVVGAYDSGLVKSAQIFGANKGVYGEKDKPSTALVVKFEGLIYLEAGESYKFNYDKPEGIDDALVINLGGKTVYEQHYYNSPEEFDPRNPLKVEPFIPKESGFYSLDMYHLNSGSEGRLGIQLNGNDLTTDNFLVYPDEKALKEALAANDNLKDFNISSLQGSIDGKNGYYTIEGNNIGEAGTWFKISNLSIKSDSNSDGIEVQTITGSNDTDDTLVLAKDKDGKDTVKLEIGGLSEGYEIRDGAGNQYTFTGKEDVIDITDWDRANLELFAPLNAEAGREGIALITSSRDGDDNITQSYTHLHINVSKDSANYSGTTGKDEIILGTSDKPGTGDNVLFGGSGDDTLDGGAGNDVLFGDSAGGVRGGGFEYWDFSNFEGNVSRDSNLNYAWLVAESNGKTEQHTIGAWNLGGRSEDYKRPERDYNNIEFANPNKGNTSTNGNKYTGSDAGSWVLDMTAHQFNELDIWQNVTTMPGETYNIEIVVSNAGDTTMHVQWGGHTIGILEEGSTTMAGLNKVQIVRETSGLPSGYSKYILTVAGDRESEFTELRILGHTEKNSSGYQTEPSSNGRILASVDLKPVGNSGADKLIGGEGEDILYGQGGNDTLWGGKFVEEGDRGDGSTDTFVYSFNKDNGHDTIKDFEVGTDRIYLTDVLDAYNGLDMGLGGMITNKVYNENDPQAKHITRTPGTNGDVDSDSNEIINSTAKSDDNLTIKDFRYDNNNGDSYNAQGQHNQYITVEGSEGDSGDVVISFGSGKSTDAGAKTAYGSVTLEGISYGTANDGNEHTYGSVEELFGYNGHQQILWATTDGFQIPKDNNYDNLTNMDMTVTDLKIDGYYPVI